MTKEQWQAIRTRDSGYDGQFYYVLRGTKKICRPSCPKKCPDPKRVMIFDTLGEALDRGFTPCSRCRPELERWAGAKPELARAAEAWLREHAGEKFSLDRLAAALHLDRSYLLRVFKEVTGNTPLEYHNRLRCEAARELLTRPELSISYIASAVGYVSASHFTQVFKRTTGETPSEYRAAYLRSLDE